MNVAAWIFFFGVLFCFCFFFLNYSFIYYDWEENLSMSILLFTLSEPNRTLIPLGSGWRTGELDQGLALWYGTAMYQLLGWTVFVWHE